MMDRRNNINDLIHKKILLVDDAIFVRNIIARLIRDLGFAKIHEADNGQAAISILNHHHIDLLITDIQMPKLNGIELIKQIRTDKTATDRGLRVIVETSFSNTEVIASCLSLDINGFLVKPFTLNMVKEKISLALTEERHLQPAEAYLQVKTDLVSLAQQIKQINTGASVSSPATIRRGVSVDLALLKPGMILEENIHTSGGMVMLSAGSVLNQSLINRIQELRKVLGNNTLIMIKADKAI